MTPSLLKLRYPAFANVPDDVVAYWLVDAGRIVTTEWGDDQEPATLALAAHNMATTPGVVSSGASSIPAGVTRFRSGSTDVSFSDTAASQAAKGGYSSSVYGRDFAQLLRVHAGSPVLVGATYPRGDYVC